MINSSRYIIHNCLFTVTYFTGNYGICKDDMESLTPWPDGFIVRELSRNFSNFRADFSIQQFLE
ncbi:MAG: hypothetical protein K2G39_10930, partial [Lachnospiraceae bacterium]|nr:hypothetical protein [Lachnospiraceae bacterium]